MGWLIGAVGFVGAARGDRGGTFAVLADRAALGAQTTTCGDANADSLMSATDAVIALRAGVGGAQCLPCICDVNRSGNISATDGLLILQSAVGQSVQLDCVACATTTTSTTTTTLPCTPKDLSGRWRFTVTEISDTCPEPLEPPFATRIVLAEDADGGVVITSPKLPEITNLMVQRSACSATISYETPETDGARFFSGTLLIGSQGDSFSGDLSWQLCAPTCTCGGVERWQGLRLP